MTPYPYMISVQWGKGHHYFLSGDFNMVAALEKAKKVHTNLVKQQRRKHNLKPRVMVWELRESVQDSELGPIIWKVQE